MKNSIFYLVISVLLTSCAATYQEIGSVSLLATHRVNEQESHKLLATNVGATKQEIKRDTAQTMNEAIKTILSKVPGGDYLTNVRLYIVKDQWLAVSGDVWGKDNAPVAVTGQSNTSVKLTSR